MSLADEIDGPSSKETAARAGTPLRVRPVVYAQLLAVAFSVVFGQCERWGYAYVLETGMAGAAFGPVVGTLFATALAFPIAMADEVRRPASRRITTWLVLALSIAMSFTQILALIPLVQ